MPRKANRENFIWGEIEAFSDFCLMVSLNQGSNHNSLIKRSQMFTNVFSFLVKKQKRTFNWHQMDRFKVFKFSNLDCHVVLCLLLN